jgi:hypothetical protein
VLREHLAHEPRDDRAIARLDRAKLESHEARTKSMNPFRGSVATKRTRT